jgi:hypothetical protein
MRHAPLPPSSAERWIHCSGSRQAEAEAPPAAPSDFANTGIRAHELFARGLHRHLPAEALTNDPIILRPLTLALATTRQILGSRPFMIEIRVPALVGLAEVWGTADIIGFSPTGPLDTIADLKFGEGLTIEADTPQLGIYALLGARCYGVADSGVTVWVIQPRADHDDGLARSYHYSRADLDRFETKIRAAATATLMPNAPRKAGPWCRWCRAALTCPERQAAPNAVPPILSGWFRPAPRWLHPETTNRGVIQ